jgi:phage major head subunit gpT-like protein
MTYHVVIKQERRQAPRQLAVSVHNQLHTLGEVVNDMSNIDYAAEWDGKSPYLINEIGDRKTLKMRYLGWPEITKEEYEKTIAASSSPDKLL